MATFILKVLGIAYLTMVVAVLIFSFSIGTTSIFVSLLAPIIFWPAYLVLCGLVGLILKSIDEHKQK